MARKKTPSLEKNSPYHKIKLLNNKKTKRLKIKKIRIIFKLKLADIIINVTSGGPGGATDSVTSFIFREYRDRSNVGYWTFLSIFYLVIIVIFMTILIKLSDRWMKPRY